MSVKRVDIDALLGENVLILRAKGKEFRLEDVPLDLFMESQNVEDENSMSVFHEQLSKLLGMTTDELTEIGIGLKAANLMIQEVQNWVLASVQEDEEGASETENPT